MDKFLEKVIYQNGYKKKHTSEQSCIIREMELIVKNLSIWKTPSTHGFANALFQTFIEKIIPITQTLRDNEKEEKLPNSFQETSIILIQNLARTLQQRKIEFKNKYAENPKPMLSKSNPGYTKRVTIRMKWSLFQEYKVGLTFECQ